jgi:hypothetical protein
VMLATKEGLVDAQFSERSRFSVLGRS